MPIHSVSASTQAIGEGRAGLEHQAPSLDRPDPEQFRPVTHSNTWKDDRSRRQAIDDDGTFCWRTRRRGAWARRRCHIWQSEPWHRDGRARGELQRSGDKGIAQRGGSGALDTIRVDHDAPLLVEATDGFLEVALADAEQSRNLIGSAFVADRKSACSTDCKTSSNIPDMVLRNGQVL